MSDDAGVPRGTSPQGGAAAVGVTAAGLGRVAVVGALLGSVMDGFHTHGGVTRYPDPVWAKAAWWTPLVFAGAYVAIALVYGWARPGPSGRDGRAKGGAVVLFGGLYAMTGFAPVADGWKVLGLLAGAGLLWRRFDGSRGGVAGGLAGAVTGPAIEWGLVRAGLFEHVGSPGGVPAWLPVLYLASGAGLGAWLADLARGDRGRVFHVERR